MHIILFSDSDDMWNDNNLMIQSSPDLIFFFLFEKVFHMSTGKEKSSQIMFHANLTVP